MWAISEQTVFTKADICVYSSADYQWIFYWKFILSLLLENSLGEKYASITAILRLRVKDSCAFVCLFLLHNFSNIPSIHLQAQKPSGPKQSYCHQLWQKIPSCKALPHFSAATGTGGGPGTAFYQAFDSTRINSKVTDSKWSHRLCVRWTETGCNLLFTSPKAQAVSCWSFGHWTQSQWLTVCLPVMYLSSLYS